MNKKKVLLVWWYDRRDLIAPYLEMKEEIEFTVLFYRFQEQEDKSVADSLPFRRIYWLDYLTPYQLLRDVKPEKILFFGNDGALTISLIIAANVQNIETCYVSHGLRSELSEVQENLEAPKTIDRYKKDNKYYTSKKWHTILFLLMTTSLKNLRTFRVVYELLRAEFKYSNNIEKLINIQNPLRKVKSYYLFAPENAIMIHGIDHPDSAQIHYTGPYMMDELFKFLHQSQDGKKQNWLMIDQPIAGFDFEQRAMLYQKIAESATKRNSRLMVKLHPMEYGRNPGENSGIIWLKNVSNLNELIAASEGVLGFYSAMLLPMISFKKCILFDTNATVLTQKWKDMGVVRLLDPKSFEKDEIDFESFEIPEKNRENFIRQFVVYTDGKCTQRLKSLILNNN